MEPCIQFKDQFLTPLIYFCTLIWVLLYTLGMSQEEGVYVFGIFVAIYMFLVYLKQDYEIQSMLTRECFEHPDTATRFCRDEQPLMIGPEHQSNNHRLQGPPNPHTLEAPANPPPIANWDHWGGKGHTFGHVVSGINDRVGFAEQQSGYLVPPPPYRQAVPIHQNKSMLSNEAQDYSPFSIPEGIPVGECNTSPELEEYNRRLFSTPIQPGIHYTADQVQPVSSNLGITKTISYPSYFNQPLKIDPSVPQRVNVVDPRYQGYGDASRRYIDSMTQRPRFAYDDVDAVRQNNFISKNKIDHLKWAPHPGIVSDHAGYTPRQAREPADRDYISGTQQMRNSLQESYMRRFNTSVAWQKRNAPVRTTNAIINWAKP